MNEEIIKSSAKSFYVEEIEGEPLDQDVPIECYVKGAEFVLNENKKNFKRALKNLEGLQKHLIHTGNQREWMLIVNSLRLCAGMELIKLKNL
jgi:hypothetical protein